MLWYNTLRDFAGETPWQGFPRAPFLTFVQHWVFRALRSAAMGRCPLDPCRLLKKAGENFNYIPRSWTLGTFGRTMSARRRISASVNASRPWAAIRSPESLKLWM